VRTVKAYTGPELPGVDEAGGSQYGARGQATDPISGSMTAAMARASLAGLLPARRTTTGSAKPTALQSSTRRPATSRSSAEPWPHANWG